MKEHAHRAQVFAERLHELNVNVTYPGLKCHPDHDFVLPNRPV